MCIFSEEEIHTFRDAGVHPLFFAAPIVGAHMPSLMHVSHYLDMEACGQAWSTLASSEGWQRIKNRPAGAMRRPSRWFRASIWPACRFRRSDSLAASIMAFAGWYNFLRRS